MIKQLPKKCTIEIKTEVISVVKGMNVEDVHTLYEKFGFFIEGYQNHPKVQAHMWDGKIRFFSMKGVTYTLLLEEILPIIQKMGYFFTITDDRTGILPKEFKVTSDIFKDCFDKYNNPFVLRDYQCLVSNILLEHGNGILVAATSAGKGSIICALCKGINSTNGFRTIVIVPNRTLVNQSVAECKQYNLEVGEYSGAVKDIDHPIVISTWQTLKNKPEVLQNFSAVIIDECFSGEMKVTMFDGTSKNIKDVVVGDVVKSYDFQSQQQCNKRVTHCHANLKRSDNDKMLRLYFDNNQFIDVTENHVFYTKDGPKKAKDLTEDDNILNTTEIQGTRASDGK